jgi:hypothetical protein
VNDELITRALSANADAIELRPGDPAAVMRRGSARRNRRRAAVGGLAVVAIAATTFSVATRDPSNDVESSDTAATVVDSPFDWTVVEPQTALGFSDRSVFVGNSVYRLSTAPGSVADDQPLVPRALYRSADGSEWSQVNMPADFSPAAIGGDGGRLYAVGTSPAGGLAIASSDDEAKTWSSLALPAAVSELGVPIEDLSFSVPRVASLDGSSVVATVVVTYRPSDVRALLPADAPYLEEVGASISAAGVTLYELVPCDEATCGDVVADPSGSTESFAAPGRTYSWEELAVAPEVAALAAGRTLVFVSDDGTTFDQVDIPAADGWRWANELVASDDGYTLVTGGEPGVSYVLVSPDGHSWTQTDDLPGVVSAAGLIGSRVAVALYHDDPEPSGQTLLVRESTGWVPVDVSGLGISGLEIGPVTFGPLGVVAIGWGENRDVLIHSADGNRLSVVDIADLVGDDYLTVSGVDITADAIAVRLGRPMDREGKPTAPQHVLVGTPR